VQIPTAAGQEGERRLSYWMELGRAQARRPAEPPDRPAPPGQDGRRPVTGPPGSSDDAANCSSGQ
jgi:hypothetical protein